MPNEYHRNGDGEVDHTSQGPTDSNYAKDISRGRLHSTLALRPHLEQYASLTLGAQIAKTEVHREKMPLPIEA